MVVQEKEIFERYLNAEILKEQYTDKTTERPMITALISNLKAGDTLCVTKLDRLARNTVEGINIVQELFNRGVAVHALNIGLLENTSMGKFFLTTLLAVAEMERNTILERTKAEKAKTKSGFKEGRPNSYKQSNLIMLLKC